ncbi:uncharacterized protein LOC115753094 isoform X1 [Rhodamnia argentea]|uniref:Uncharacterized protein LOC115753094 isoform X1 n=1 Tax=Rhodamnia argentea TaxID=178133 RepID=A0A8B8QLT7_9MYRT|nr:uncharacterized protein LOC115753094 isoform X1 [Rhodamnia argentea]
MALMEEPIISRIDRLDNMIKQLEEIGGCSRSFTKSSSGASTPSSGTLTSEGHASSVDFSPESLEKYCRPLDHVMVETEAKGSLVERLHHLEVRLHKLCLQVEEELVAERKTIQGKSQKKGRKKKGLKQMVKSLVEGGRKHHKSTSD